MGSLHRTLLLLTLLGAVGTISCSDSISEPIADRFQFGGRWEGVARLDTVRLQLVDREVERYNLFTVGGTGTYSQAATGNRWPLDVMGTIEEIWLTNASHDPLLFEIRAHAENRLTGTLFVMLRNPVGDRIVQDSMPFNLLRQP